MVSALLVFLGGGIGSVVRYIFSIAFNQAIWPYGTLWSNVISCFVLGIVMGMAHKAIFSDPMRLFFTSGFCGGFSTFSTYSAEIVTLYQAGAYYHAIGYGILSVIAGLLAIIIGMSLGKLLN